MQPFKQRNLWSKTTRRPHLGVVMSRHKNWKKVHTEPNQFLIPMTKQIFFMERDQIKKVRLFVRSEQIYTIEANLKGLAALQDS